MPATCPQQLHDSPVNCRTSWGVSALEASRLGWLKATLRLWGTDLRDPCKLPHVQLTAAAACVLYVQSVGRQCLPAPALHALAASIC